MDGHGTGAPCPHQGQEVRAEEVAPVTRVVSQVKEASDLQRLQQWVLLCPQGHPSCIALPALGITPGVCWITQLDHSWMAIPGGSRSFIHLGVQPAALLV